MDFSKITVQDLLVALQIIGTILIGVIGFMLKNVLESNLGPIKLSINLLTQDVTEITTFLKEHGNAVHPHPVFLEYMESRKFAGKEETESNFENLNHRLDKLEDRE